MSDDSASESHNDDFQTERSQAPSQQAPTALQFIAVAKEQEDDLLRKATGCFYLEEATTCSLVVDTTESSIAHLGTKLPALCELHLNGSVLDSLRDLGTHFTKLNVLWISRCSLRSLDGLGSALGNIQELYASFNEITDLSPLADLERLEVLDLEGNNITDMDTLEYLGMCPRITVLNLSLNPVANREGYRGRILAALPGLQTLDDEAVGGWRRGGGGGNDENEPNEDDMMESLRREMREAQEELEMIKDAIKYTTPLISTETDRIEDDIGSLACMQRPRTSLVHPGTSSRPQSSSTTGSGTRPSSSIASGARPGTATSSMLSRPASSKIGSRPGSGAVASMGNGKMITTSSSSGATGLFWKKNRIADSDKEAVEGGDVEGDASELSRGDSAFGGNLAKALRERRHQGGDSLAQDVSLNHDDLLSELRQWKDKQETTEDGVIIAEQGQYMRATRLPSNDQEGPRVVLASGDDDWGVLPGEEEALLIPPALVVSDEREATFTETHDDQANVLTLGVPESSSLAAPRHTGLAPLARPIRDGEKGVNPLAAAAQRAAKSNSSTTTTGRPARAAPPPPPSSSSPYSAKTSGRAQPPPISKTSSLPRKPPIAPEEAPAPRRSVTNPLVAATSSKSLAPPPLAAPVSRKPAVPVTSGRTATNTAPRNPLMQASSRQAVSSKAP